MNDVAAYDVCVAGGGSAGVAAAVAAARLGARTLLIERHGSLGGMATAALVHSICGLYRLPEKESVPALANDGFAAEFASRLVSRGGASGPLRLGRVDVLLQRPTAFARVADDLVRLEAPGLDVRLHTEITAASADTITMTCRGVSTEARARAWVDATGDAVLALLRGADFEIEPPEHLQRPAFIFALGGIAPETLDDDGRLRLARHIVGAAQAGSFRKGLLGAHFRASPQPGEAFVTIDLAGGDRFDPLDAACLTQLETDGRALAECLITYLRAKADGFANSYIAAWPARVGVRESRRILGQYRLEAEDIMNGATFSDTVAYSAWPMEFRETANGPRWRFPPEGRSCGVPLRALRARDDDHLFMAGRCLSCSHEAHAALRVIGTCLATGEAAGLAAALLATTGDCAAREVCAARERIKPR
jgi:glycine/D-amino acid oxidase-like deaminating enzyme